MRKVLLGFLVAAGLAALTAGMAFAGLNSGAVAHLYWQGTPTGTGLAARDNTSGTPNILVTVTGLVEIRGADVQILINALDGNGPPPAWQFQLGGCSEGFATYNVGGKSAAKNAFNVAPSVLGVVASQNSFNFNTGDCRTNNHTGLFWLSAAGANGGTRTPATEYNLWSINLDLATGVEADGVTPCAGGASDPAGPKGVCLNLNFRVPCNGPQLAEGLELIDGSLAQDFVAAPVGNQFLTWNVGLLAAQCPKVTPLSGTTWGRLKKSYR